MSIHSYISEKAAAIPAGHVSPVTMAEVDAEKAKKQLIADINYALNKLNLRKLQRVLWYVRRIW